MYDYCFTNTNIALFLKTVANISSSFLPSGKSFVSRVQYSPNKIIKMYYFYQKQNLNYFNNIFFSLINHNRWPYNIIHDISI